MGKTLSPEEKKKKKISKIFGSGVVLGDFRSAPTQKARIVVVGAKKEDEKIIPVDGEQMHVYVGICKDVAEEGELEVDKISEVFEISEVDRTHNDVVDDSWAQTFNTMSINKDLNGVKKGTKTADVQIKVQSGSENEALLEDVERLLEIVKEQQKAIKEEQRKKREAAKKAKVATATNIADTDTANPIKEEEMSEEENKSQNQVSQDGVSQEETQVVDNVETLVDNSQAAVTEDGENDENKADQQLTIDDIGGEGGITVPYQASWTQAETLESSAVKPEDRMSPEEEGGYVQDLIEERMREVVRAEVLKHVEEDLSEDKKKLLDESVEKAVRNSGEMSNEEFNKKLFAEETLKAIHAGMEAAYAKGIKEPQLEDIRIEPTFKEEKVKELADAVLKDLGIAAPTVENETPAAIVEENKSQDKSGELETEIAKLYLAAAQKQVSEKAVEKLGVGADENMVDFVNNLIVKGVVEEHLNDAKTFAKRAVEADANLKVDEFKVELTDEKVAPLLKETLERAQEAIKQVAEPQGQQQPPVAPQPIQQPNPQPNAQPQEQQQIPQQQNPQEDEKVPENKQNEEIQIDDSELLKNIVIDDKLVSNLSDAELSEMSEVYGKQILAADGKLAEQNQKLEALKRSRGAEQRTIDELEKSLKAYEAGVAPLGIKPDQIKDANYLANKSACADAARKKKDFDGQISELEASIDKADKARAVVAAKKTIVDGFMTIHKTDAEIVGLNGDLDKKNKELTRAKTLAALKTSQISADVKGEARTARETEINAPVQKIQTEVDGLNKQIEFKERVIDEAKGNILGALSEHTEFYNPERAAELSVPKQPEQHNSENKDDIKGENGGNTGDKKEKQHKRDKKKKKKDEKKEQPVVQPTQPAEVADEKESVVINMAWVKKQDAAALVERNNSISAEIAKRNGQIVTWTQEETQLNTELAQINKEIEAGREKNKDRIQEEYYKKVENKYSDGDVDRAAEVKSREDRLKQIDALKVNEDEKIRILQTEAAYNQAVLTLIDITNEIETREQQREFALEAVNNADTKEDKASAQKNLDGIEADLLRLTGRKEGSKNGECVGGQFNEQANIVRQYRLAQEMNKHPLPKEETAESKKPAAKPVKVKTPKAPTPPKEKTPKPAKVKPEEKEEEVAEKKPTRAETEEAARANNEARNAAIQKALEEYWDERDEILDSDDSKAKKKAALAALEAQLDVTFEGILDEFGKPTRADAKANKSIKKAMELEDKSRRLK